MDRERRDQLVEQYRNGYQIIMDALKDITAEEMDAREAPGEWSPRQVCHHLADSEMTSAIRLRRLLASEKPHIQGYDQEAFADILFYDRPVEASLEAFRAARATTSEILDRMSEEQWQREGTHSEGGTYGVLQWLELYANHAPDHADQIARARATVKMAGATVP
jgi:hypothetical protein